MAFVAAFGVFFAVMFTVYGLFSKPTPRGVVADRVSSLRGATGGPAGPVPGASARDKFGSRILTPLVGSMGRSFARLLPSGWMERVDRSLVQAGMKMSASHFLGIVGVTAGFLPVLFALYMSANGLSGAPLLLLYGALVAFGLYGPRIWLLGRIKRRQKAIWKALPDCFDLVTASVEAGLGIDAAFQRVLDRVEGPLGEELGRALREIQVGRSRKEAFGDMAARTGVDEFESIISAIVQAETMGISISGVVRQQTHMLRVKRRQKAEEQAFKAPIKMVFPLVFCVFPAIGIVIGGPAVIQIMDLLG